MPEHAALAERLARRDRDAVPEALNLLDDRRPGRREAALGLLATLERAAAAQTNAGAARIGITGAPGAGKSTLLDALVRRLRARGQTVGIVAVDPSSRVSGGALLGDRARVRSGARDRGVFFRSMAARERLGGLADATWPSMAVLSAVFDVVFVETVGVGQSEAEVTELVDTLLFVAQPGAGDVLQFMKAGILEHPDVFAVNKADVGAAAERTAGELAAGLSLGAQADADWRPPVLLVSARDGRGIDELADALAAHRAHLVASGELAERRRRARTAYVSDTLERRYGSFGVERIGGREALRARADAGHGAGFETALAIGREIEAALGKPA
ncbi:MAG: methylmalonyl Co-A mutase-associated GTPase MeaB [Proteobacteria bacterium]|nr:MAG: methylmalonyl Co-A mutase-associated GTPase MeaB [Pseudomonadota bacterium]